MRIDTHVAKNRVSEIDCNIHNHRDDTIQYPDLLSDKNDNCELRCKKCNIQIEPGEFEYHWVDTPSVSFCSKFCAMK